MNCISMTVHAQAYYFQPVSKPFDNVAKRLNRLDRLNRREQATAADIDSLRRFAENNRQLQARTIFWQVRMNQINAQPAKCIAMLKKAETLCQPGFDYDLALIRYQLAGNYERLGKYLQCYEYCQKALPVLLNTSDNFFLGNTYLLLVQLFNDVDDNEHARINLALAKKYYSRAGFPLNRIYFFEAQLTSDKKLKILNYKKSIASGANDWALTIQAYDNLCSLQLSDGKTEEALASCDAATKLIQDNDPHNIYTNALIVISRAKVYYYQGKYKLAIGLLNGLLKLSPQLRDEQFFQEVYHYLWLCYDRLGQRNMAYTMLVNYQKEYERQARILHARDVPKAQARDEILRQNDRLKLVEKDAQLKTGYLYLTLLAFAIVIIAGLALAIFFRQRYRIRKIENKQLRDNLRQEALIYSVNRKNFENDIKQKECEISSSTLLLANKNEVLRQISDITHRFSSKGQIPQSYVQQVNNVIADSLKNDDEWSRFKLHFDAVHPNFFVKLKEICPELTENDLRLCAYICIGIRPKQISEMLNVSPDSVNSNRYRLRKKFGLSRNDSLDDFIRNVG